MNLTNIDKVRCQVRKVTPDSIVELISSQIDRADEAARRIDTEGIVVRDMKGSVIQHPAIKIEMDAHKVIADLMGKWK